MEKISLRWCGGWQIDILGCVDYTIHISAPKFMNAAPQSNPTVWYMDSNPNANVIKLFTEKGYQVSEIKRGPELVAACERLKAQSAEIKRPDIVLLGSLDAYDDPKKLVLQMASCGIETFVPFGRYVSSNHILLIWPQEEKEKERVGSIKIIGFGGKSREGRPLLLFQYAEDAEKHWADFEKALYPNDTRPPGAKR